MRLLSAGVPVFLGIEVELIRERYLWNVIRAVMLLSGLLKLGLQVLDANVASLIDGSDCQLPFEMTAVGGLLSFIGSFL